jgi:hypothetical protein
MDMVDRWQQNHSYGGKSTTERQVEAVAGRQLQLVTVTQLLAAGLTRRVVETRSDQRRLFRLHTGVYATHPPPYSRQQKWLAAVLACGPEAYLCGPSCAQHWDIAEIPSLTAHVCSPARAGRSRAGITVHRRRLDPRDVRIKGSIPCVSVDVVLIDLAPALSEAELETVLVAAESKHLLKRGRLAELIAANHGRPGISKLFSLLALEPAITRSQQEIDFLPICRLAGVERPKVNFPIYVPSQPKPLEVDFAWPSLRMVVEADSQRFHGDWERAAADRERDQQLALAGWLCHRFVRRKLVNDRAGSAERLHLLSEARIAELGVVNGGASSASS